MVNSKVVVEKIMDANDQVAVQIQTQLTSRKVFAINLMVSPGAVKTMSQPVISI